MGNCFQAVSSVALRVKTREVAVEKGEGKGKREKGKNTEGRGGPRDLGELGSSGGRPTPDGS